MGGGGGKSNNQQLQLQQQQMALQQSQFAASQAETARQQAAQDAATQAQIQALFASANGQTPQAQNKAKLSVLDFIHTSPEGLLNKPKTGQLNILGN